MSKKKVTDEIKGIYFKNINSANANLSHLCTDVDVHFLVISEIEHSYKIPESLTQSANKAKEYRKKVEKFVEQNPKCKSLDAYTSHGRDLERLKEIYNKGLIREPDEVFDNILSRYLNTKQRKYLEGIMFLIDKVDLNREKWRYADRPIYRAAINGDLGLYHLLLQHGANPFLETEPGQCAASEIQELFERRQRQNYSPTRQYMQQIPTQTIRQFLDEHPEFDISHKPISDIYFRKEF